MKYCILVSLRCGIEGTFNLLKNSETHAWKKLWFILNITNVSVNP